MECKFKVCLHSSYIRKRKDLLHLKQFIFLHVKMFTWAGFLFPHFSSLEPKKRWNRFSSISALLSLPDSVCKFSSFILTGEWEKKRENHPHPHPHPSSPCISLSTFNSELFWFSYFPLQHQHRFLSIVFIHCVSFAFHLFTVCLSIQVYLIGPLSYFLSDTFLSNLFSHSPFLTPSFPPFPLPFFSYPSILFLFSSIFYPLSFFLLTFATILHFSHSKNLLQNLILKTHSKT